jgi:hypothetical protein
MPVAPDQGASAFLLKFDGLFHIRGIISFYVEYSLNIKDCYFSFVGWLYEEDY